MTAYSVPRHRPGNNLSMVHLKSKFSQLQIANHSITINILFNLGNDEHYSVRLSYPDAIFNVQCFECSDRDAPCLPVYETWRWSAAYTLQFHNLITYGIHGIIASTKHVN